jgi:hypothetical protein
MLRSHIWDFLVYSLFSPQGDLVSKVVVSFCSPSVRASAVDVLKKKIRLGFEVTATVAAALNCR